MPTTTAETIAAADRPTPLALRNDTMLGVCAALGQDLGFNPNYLRVAISSIVLFNIALAVGIYLGLGIVVAASRLMFPVRYATPAVAASGSPAIEANDAPAAPESLAA